MNAAVTTELKTIGHWIGGESVSGDSGRNGPGLQPGDGRADGRGALRVGRGDRSARSPPQRPRTPTWRHWSLSKRAELFFRIYQLVDEHRDDLARLLTAEHGKVLSDAHGEVQRGIEVIEYVCGIPELLKGAYSEQASSGIDVYSIRQPLGVVAGITPFNFPAMVPMWMWAPAIACGNTFVLKPSEKDPSASLLVGELLQGGRAPGRCLQRRAGRQGRGRRDPRSTRTSPPCRSSARRRSRATSTRRGRRPVSACRRSAARRTT